MGGDKAFDTANFVAECRSLKVTPRVAQNLGRPGGSAIDARTTQHVGCAISQRRRKRVAECFGWVKTIALLRKVRHRGIFKVGWVFTFAAAPAIWCGCGIWRFKRRRPRSQCVRGPEKESASHQRMQPKLSESQDRGTRRESKSRTPFFRSLLERN